jgi:hypothetical protein
VLVPFSLCFFQVGSLLLSVVAAKVEPAHFEKAEKQAAVHRRVSEQPPYAAQALYSV